MTNTEYMEFLMNHGDGHGSKKDNQYNNECNKTLTMKDWEHQSEWYISHYIYDIGHGDFILERKINMEDNKNSSIK